MTSVKQLVNSTRSRATASLNQTLEKNLAAYIAAATAAGMSTLALTPPAEARIVYTHAHWVSRGNLPYHLDLNHDGITDFKLYQSILQFQSYILVRPTHRSNQIKGSGGFASALHSGDRIEPSKKFARQNSEMLSIICKSSGCYNFSTAGFWGNSGNGVKDRYLGLKFYVSGEAHYGWARLNVVRKRWWNATLTGYAYETIPNKPIIAGKTKGSDVIPVQPGTLGHLAAGAAAIPAGRRSELVTTRH
jgi:hypothetical protein